jgi:hypothetical protein
MLMASLAMLLPARATTLLRLSMDDMIQQSTAIVRAKVTGSSSEFRGQDIYTYYQLQILETVKPSGQTAQTAVAVPGGSAGGVRQVVAGAPTLTVGGEYVLFLWTSRSGLTQAIGLSQGLFSVTYDASGNASVSRPAAAGIMLDVNGNVAADQAVSLKWSDLRTHIQQKLAAGK